VLRPFARAIRSWSSYRRRVTVEAWLWQILSTPRELTGHLARHCFAYDDEFPVVGTAIRYDLDIRAVLFRGRAAKIGGLLR